jgi:hypothetical protein
LTAVLLFLSSSEVDLKKEKLSELNNLLKTKFYGGFMKHVSISITALLILFIIGFIPQLGFGQWPNNPTDPLQICWRPEDQVNPCIVYDDWNGAIIVWEDRRDWVTNGTDIYIERVDKNGYREYVSGEPVISGKGEQRYPQVTSGNKGRSGWGTFVVWDDIDTTMNLSLRIQRLNPLFLDKAWDPAGLPIAWINSTRSHARIKYHRIDDLEKYLWVTYLDPPFLYLRKIDPFSGGIIGGNTLGATNVFDYDLEIDNKGRALITWVQYTGGNIYLYAQRVNKQSLCDWGPTLVSTIQGSPFSVSPKIIDNGNDGAIVSYNNNGIIRAQMVNTHGSIEWLPDGIEIYQQTLVSEETDMISDDNGGGLMFIRDHDPHLTNDTLEVCHFTYGGSVDWYARIPNMGFCLPNIATDGQGGLFLTYLERIANPPENKIYIKHISSGGVILCSGDEIPIPLTSDNYIFVRPQIVNGGCGAIITWADDRNPTSKFNIYAYQMDAHCNHGTVCPIELVTDGWNLLSIPIELIRHPCYSKPYLCYFDDFHFPPEHIPFPPFRYDDAYKQFDTLEMGFGFWMKFDSAQSISFTGDPCTSDTFTLNKGWNIVGSVTYPVDVNSIESIPPGIFSSNFFGYTDHYIIADTIEPLHGYWLKVSDTGKIILRVPPDSSMTKNASVNERLNKLNKITITDAKGRKQALYISAGQLPVDIFGNLPPIPPEGGFDVRFSDGKYIEQIDQTQSKTLPIHISSPVLPVVISWEMKQKLQDAKLIIGNKEVSLLDNGEIKISQLDSRNEIQIRSQMRFPIPKEFTLEQNYPNPFNPVTIIHYSLPVNCWVTLKVYNMLGQRVETLIEKQEEAGYKSIEFDASGLASGIYTYRLTVGTYTDVKKLILLK